MIRSLIFVHFMSQIRKLHNENVFLLNYQEETSENLRGGHPISGTPCRRWGVGKTLFFVRISLPLIELARRGESSRTVSNEEKLRAWSIGLYNATQSRFAG